MEKSSQKYREKLLADLFTTYDTAKRTEELLNIQLFAERLEEVISEFNLDSEKIKHVALLLETNDINHLDLLEIIKAW